MTHALLNPHQLFPPACHPSLFLYLRESFLEADQPQYPLSKWRNFNTSAPPRLTHVASPCQLVINGVAQIRDHSQVRHPGHGWPSLSGCWVSDLLINTKYDPEREASVHHAPSMPHWPHSSPLCSVVHLQILSTFRPSNISTPSSSASSTMTSAERPETPTREMHISQELLGSRSLP